MKIFITGAGGTIGENLTRFLAAEHQITASLHHKEDAEKFDGLDTVTTVELDITSEEACLEKIKDVDVVVHLAGVPRADAPFEETLKLNISGMRNVLAAAEKNGAKRFLFASSIHAVDGYPADKQVEFHEMVRPGDIYGVSKAFGEALCSYYAFHTDIECIAIRIADYDGFDASGETVEVDVRKLSTLLDPDDFNNFVDRCLTVEMKEPYYLLHASSKNSFNRLSMLGTKVLLDGYEPKADAFKKAGVELEKELDADDLAQE